MYVIVKLPHRSISQRFWSYLIETKDAKPKWSNKITLLTKGEVERYSKILQIQGYAHEIKFVELHPAF